MAWIGISYLFGLFIASFFNIRQNLIIDISLFLISAVLFISLKNKRALILIVSVPVMISILSNVAYTKFCYNKIVSYDNKNVSFIGKIIDISEKASDKALLTVKGKINDETDAEIVIYTDMTEMDYDDHISFNGTMQRPINTVSFASEDYYKPKGVYLNCFDVSDLNISEKSFSIRRYIMHYRDYLFDEINSILPGEEGAFIGAMLCGDKSEMSQSVKLSLYRTGIGHIFAVSGTHLIIIVSIILILLNNLRLNRVMKFLILEIFICVFIIFSGASSSVIRAGIMLSVIYISDLFKRKPDTLNTLGLCAIILTAFNPYLIRNMSFVLSMSGAFSIGVASPAVIREFRFKGRFITLKKNVVSLITLSLCMFPVSVFCFNEVSLVSPLANIILIPVCSFALVLAVIVAFIGGISFFANPMLIAAGLCIKFVLGMASILNRIPFSYISTGNSYLKVFVLLAFALSAISLFKFRSSIRKAFMPIIMSAVLVVVGTTASVVSDKSTLHLFLLSDKVSRSLLLYKGNQAVIIDLYGKGNMSQAIEKYIEKFGLKKVEALFINDKNADNVNSAYKESIYTDINYSFRTSDGMSNKDITYVSENTSIKINGYEITVLKDGGYLLSYSGVTIECLKKLENSMFDTNIKILYDDKRLMYGNQNISLTSDNGDAFHISLYGDSDFSVKKLEY